MRARATGRERGIPLGVVLLLLVGLQALALAVGLRLIETPTAATP